MTARDGDGRLRRRRGPASRVAWAAAAVLLAAGLALPAETLAGWLVEQPPDRVVLGAWLFKGLLVVHALAVAGLGTYRPRSGPPPVGSRGGSTQGRPPPAGGRARGATVRGVGATKEGGTTGGYPRNGGARIFGKDRLLLVLLLLVGAALRFYRLDEGMWLDEVMTLVNYASQPLGTILVTFDSQNQHLLYSVLGHLSLAAFGEGAWALRLPAVLLGLGSLWAVYWFGRQVTGRREALLACALLTVSYHHVWFSQNARGYTGLLLWTLVATALFLRLIRRRHESWRVHILYGLAAAAGVLTHLTAALVVVAHALIWAVLAGRRRLGGRGATVLPVVAFALATTFSLQGYAFALPQLMDTLLEPATEGVTTSWQNPLWFVTETLRGLGRAVPGGLPVLAGGALVGVAGLTHYALRSPVAAWAMVLPPVLMAATLIALRHNLWPRLFFFCFGFAALIGVRGLFLLSRRLARVLPERAPGGKALGTAAAAVLALASASTVPGAWGPKQDFRGAWEWVRERVGPGDVVATVDLTVLPYADYYACDCTPVTGADALRSLERMHDRTWILYTFPTRLAAVHPDLWERLRREYRVAEEFPGSVNGGTLWISVRE